MLKGTRRRSRGRSGPGAGGRGAEGGRSTLDSAAFKCLLFCGFLKKKKLLAFSWLSATSRLRAHVTSHPTPKASHLEPSSPDVGGGLGRGGYVLNQICIQSGERRGSLCSGTARLQACLCRFVFREGPSVAPHHPAPKVRSPAPTRAWRRCSALLPPRCSALCRWTHLLRNRLPTSGG